MEKLSIVLIARNEEKNIKDCLESVKWASEIIFIDQSSNDKTVEIASNHTDKIFITEAKGICNPDRDFGIGKTTNEWILLIEADERISEELKKEVQEIVSSENSKDIYFVSVKTFFIGKWIKTCGWYPSHIPRLFKKGKIKFQYAIHTNGEFLSGKVGYLKNDLMHYSYNSMDDWIEKFKRYTTQIAIEYSDNGKKINVKNTVMELFFRPIYFFLLKYVVLKGYKDGWRGFFISLSSSLTIIMAYFKLWELNEKNRNAEFIAK